MFVFFSFSLKFRNQIYVNCSGQGFFMLGPSPCESWWPLPQPGMCYSSVALPTHLPFSPGSQGTELCTWCTWVAPVLVDPWCGSIQSLRIWWIYPEATSQHRNPCLHVEKQTTERRGQTWDFSGPLGQRGWQNSSLLNLLLEANQYWGKYIETLFVLMKCWLVMDDTYKYGVWAQE